MDENEFLREKEKLKEIIIKLKNEEEEYEDALKKTAKNNSKDSFVRAHLMYLNEQKLQNLKKIFDKPYFARVDFKADDEEKEEKLYIGKISVLDSDTQDAIIVDWRSPIANLYYDGRVGKSCYEIPGIRTISGDISLKRQYIIEKEILQKYVDIDIKTNDELLQVALEEKADDRLKNIVATIQSEQNNIIRANMDKALIVQGVAGSRKNNNCTS